MPVPVISIAQMREWEQATWSSGISEFEVIRRVGRELASHAVGLTQPGDRILVLAGKGNNGADARNGLDALDERRVELLNVHDLESAFVELEKQLALRPALIIDGLFGIGINRPLNAPWIHFIERINAAALPVLAVDIPSGLNADSGEPQGAAINAFVTVTVGAAKTGLLKPAAWPYVGELRVANEVGLIPCPIASDLNWTMVDDFADFPPRRPAAGHKGSFGHLAIVAGSMGYHGAAVLAARGAQRAQPGLITLLPHESAYAACAAQLQAAMVQPWSKEMNFSSFSAILAGPGLASPNLTEDLKRTVQELWKKTPLPMIVDASALNWLEPGGTPDNAIRVITPHPGEAARLLKKTSAEIQADRPLAVRELSRQFGNCWVVLKGHQTLVGRSNGQLFVNSSGNPFLAQGGAGDVLAGYVAGLLAQPALQSEALKTIRFAVWQHGATADALQAARSGWTIEDLATALGTAGRRSAKAVDRPESKARM